MSDKPVVALIFGGRSVEHEVSVLTAHQVLAALPLDRFTPLPIYIAKDGVWYIGEALHNLERFGEVDALIRDCVAVVPALDVGAGGTLYRQSGGNGKGLFHRGDSESVAARFDVAFPLIHGSHGEDGTLSGVFELADVAYVGCGVTAAAVGMDKPLSRRIFAAAGLPVLEDHVVYRPNWVADPDAVVVACLRACTLPVYVKPATLGSSVGVSRVIDEAGLRDALELAFFYDTRAVVEAAQDDIVEINCAVLDTANEVRVSVCEQPTKIGLLSYQDKYAGGGKGGGAKQAAVSTGSKSAGMAAADRIIPAPLEAHFTSRIQDAARRAFVAIGASGVARVDFLVRPQQEWFVVNEINTLPGSLSFYLWGPAGLSFPDLLTVMIEQAQVRRQQKATTVYSIDDWLLRAATGAAVKR